MLTKRCLGYPRSYGHSSQFQELYAINLLKIRNFTKSAFQHGFSNCKRLLRNAVVFLRQVSGVCRSNAQGGYRRNLEHISTRSPRCGRSRYGHTKSAPSSARTAAGKGRTVRRTAPGRYRNEQGYNRSPPPFCQTRSPGTKCPVSGNSQRTATSCIPGADTALRTPTEPAATRAAE